MTSFNDSQEIAEPVQPIGKYSTIITIGNAQLEIDGSDPDFIDTLQKAWVEIKNFKVPESVSDTEKTRLYVDRMDQFFDEIFGTGTAADAFNTRSLMKRINAWDSIFTMIKDQETAMSMAAADFNSKYNSGNRATRRAIMKNHKATMGS